MILIDLLKQSAILKKSILSISLILYSIGWCFALGNDSELLFNEFTGKNEAKLEVFAEFKPATAKPGSVITLKVLGRISPGFHIYSVNSQGEFSPDPTKLILHSDEIFQAGTLKESKPIKIIDKAFNLELEVHKNDFWFEQDFHLSEVSKPGARSWRGYVLYQICDNRICSFPLERDFQVQLNVSN